MTNTICAFLVGVLVGAYAKHLVPVGQIQTHRGTTDATCETGNTTIQGKGEQMNDTPRTDDRVVFIDKNPWVNAPFVRGLERELNAANKRISYLEEAVQDSIDACDRDIGILQQRMSNLKLAKEAKP